MPHRKRKDGFTLLNLRVTEEDKRAMLAAADRYSNGNLSAWLRYAGAKYKPAKTESPVLAAGERIKRAPIKFIAFETPGVYLGVEGSTAHFYQAFPGVAKRLRKRRMAYA